MSMPDDLVGVRFASAAPDSLPALTAFLAESGLPGEDLSAGHLPGFELALDEAGRLVGVAGLETAGKAGLLRSVAVLPGWRSQGLGQRLVMRREAAAAGAGVVDLYLLTTSAAAFFARLGYQDAERNEVPAAIAAHPQFRRLCPVSARCMKKSL